jgi:hypothetical protein
VLSVRELRLPEELPEFVAVRNAVLEGTPRAATNAGT